MKQPDVFTSGLEGYECYRIPSLIRLPSARLLAFAEGRKDNCYDPPNRKIDVVYKASDDDGATWSSLRLLYGEPGRVAIHNPVPVAVGGRVLVVFGRNIRSLLTMRSLDARGDSWPENATDITAEVVDKARLGRGVVPGPPQGLAFAMPNGTVRVAVAAGGDAFDGRHGVALLSDDGGLSWRTSAPANGAGAEAQIALAPNGSLLLNARGPRQGVRQQSASHDFGQTWSAPRVLDFSFGSSCEGSLVRAGPRTLLFSHAGRIDGRIGRWNLTVWASTDSGATYTAVEQVEAGLNVSALKKLHTAYSALSPLNATHAALLYERGPMPPWHTVWGEYATIRWHVMKA